MLLEMWQQRLLAAFCGQWPFTLSLTRSLAGVLMFSVPATCGRMCNILRMYIFMYKYLATYIYISTGSNVCHELYVGFTWLASDKDTYINMYICMCSTFSFASFAASTVFST